MSFDHAEHRASVHGGARLCRNGADTPGDRSLELILHLHGLDDDQGSARVDLLPLLHQDADDSTWHRAHQVSCAATARATLERSFQGGFLPRAYVHSDRRAVDTDVGRPGQPVEHDPMVPESIGLANQGSTSVTRGDLVASPVDDGDASLTFAAKFHLQCMTVNSNREVLRGHDRSLVHG